MDSFCSWPLGKVYQLHGLQALRHSLLCAGMCSCPGGTIRTLVYGSRRPGVAAASGGIELSMGRGFSCTASSSERGSAGMSFQHGLPLHHGVASCTIPVSPEALLLAAGPQGPHSSCCLVPHPTTCSSCA